LGSSDGKASAGPLPQTAPVVAPPCHAMPPAHACVLAALLWGAPAGAVQLQQVAEAAEADCRTALQGEECYRQVDWLTSRGLTYLRFPTLNKSATFEDVQEAMNADDLWFLVCPTRPCRAGQNEDSSRVASDDPDADEDLAAPFVEDTPPELPGQAQKENATQAASAPGRMCSAPGLACGPARPRSTGCFVWLPNGCKTPRHFHAKFHWRRDVWGEANVRAGQSEEACKARKRAFDAWCGVTDAVMLPVLAAPHENEGAARGLPVRIFA